LKICLTVEVTGLLNDVSQTQTPPQRKHHHNQSINQKVMMTHQRQQAKRLRVSDLF
jgi:hypothetical protein